MAFRRISAGIMVGGALALLAACTTPEERIARAEAQLAADRAECQTLGFEPGTDAHGECILKLREIRAEERTAREIRRSSHYYAWPYFGHPFYPGFRPHRHYW